MKTRISADNPFGYDRYGFAFEFCPTGAKCLDYGCNDGKFMRICSAHRHIEFSGADKNADAVSRIADFEVTPCTNPLPFDREVFDCVTCLEVLEHIHDQDAVLRELWRVLKPSGRLVASVPRRHMLSFLDVGNWKFVFPRLHEQYHRLHHCGEEYSRRFRHNPYGLVGDIEEEKAWHQHFRPRELRCLLTRNGFEIVLLDGAGYFQRVFWVLDIFRLGGLIPKRVRNWDWRTFDRVNLFCVAKKVARIS